MEFIDKLKKINFKKILSLLPSIIGIVLCAILLPILIINCILIIKGIVNKDEVPTIGGYAPLIVLTESMDPEIKSGDLIFVKVVETKDIEIGMYISFYDPDSSKNSVVTHAVINKYTDSTTGIVYFETQGVNNDLADRLPVPAENVIGVFVKRIAGLGTVAMFMQSTLGLILFVVIPLAGFITYDVIRRKKKDQDIDKLKAELEALKSQE